MAKAFWWRWQPQCELPMNANLWTKSNVSQTYVYIFIATRHDWSWRTHTWSNRTMLTDGNCHECSALYALCPDIERSQHRNPQCESSVGWQTNNGLLLRSARRSGYESRLLFCVFFVVVLFVSAGKVFYCQASFSIHEATNQSICSFAHKHCSAQPFRRLCVFIFIFFTAHIRNGCVFSCSPWPRQLSVQMQTMLCLDKFTAIRFRISQENKCVVYIENESREWKQQAWTNANVHTHTFAMVSWSCKEWGRQTSELIHFIRVRAKAASHI